MATYKIKFYFMVCVLVGVFVVKHSHAKESSTPPREYSDDMPNVPTESIAQELNDLSTLSVQGQIEEYCINNRKQIAVYDLDSKGREAFDKSRITCLPKDGPNSNDMIKTEFPSGGKVRIYNLTASDAIIVGNQDQCESFNDAAIAKRKIGSSESKDYEFKRNQWFEVKYLLGATNCINAHVKNPASSDDSFKDAYEKDKAQKEKEAADKQKNKPKKKIIKIGNGDVPSNNTESGSNATPGN